MRRRFRAVDDRAHPRGPSTGFIAGLICPGEPVNNQRIESTHMPIR
jgi:hypothetical protein